jgi:tetratricopeptide (TPR) repeat protein
MATYAVGAAIGGTTSVRDASRLCEAALEAHADSPRRRAYFLLDLASCLALSGDIVAARETATAAITILEELGEELGLGTSALFRLGDLEATTGDWSRAEECWRRGLEYTRDRPGLKDFHTYFLARLGESALEQAAVESAAGLAEQAAAAAVVSDVETNVWWRRVAARALSATGHSRKAVRLGREALAIADDTDYVLLRSGGRLDLAEVQQGAGRIAEARTGVRNWDYRYCWLRDATFTLYALLLLDDRDAARAFWHWISTRCAQNWIPDLQIMYGVRGECELPERTLDHLDGYRGSKPVRIGNAAHGQRQFDIYGELLDAYWLYREEANEVGEPMATPPDMAAFLSAAATMICDIWREPDAGIWEARAAPRHHVYSKTMCWVGLDRAIKLAEREPDAFKGDLRRWNAERAAIRSDILRHGYDERIGAFTMAYDGNDLDAAILRMPLVGFLPATDPRMRSTIRRIQEHLTTDGLVRRYQPQTDDGLPPGEGAFAICTFWLVDCLIALGEIDAAQALFERMLGYASDLGLFAEEIDPATGDALGNYPQAFTHLALIDAAVDLTEALERRAPVAEPTAGARAVAVRRCRTSRLQDQPL